jgi:energy-coupling factor transporter transmembrane protein EcfT
VKHKREGNVFWRDVIYIVIEDGVMLAIHYLLILTLFLILNFLVNKSLLRVPWRRFLFAWMLFVLGVLLNMTATYLNGGSMPFVSAPEGFPQPEEPRINSSGVYMHKNLDEDSRAKILCDLIPVAYRFRILTTKGGIDIKNGGIMSVGDLSIIAAQWYKRFLCIALFIKIFITSKWAVALYNKWKESKFEILGI